MPSSSHVTSELSHLTPLQLTHSPFFSILTFLCKPIGSWLTPRRILPILLFGEILESLHMFKRAPSTATSCLLRSGWLLELTFLGSGISVHKESELEITRTARSSQCSRAWCPPSYVPQPSVLSSQWSNSSTAPIFWLYPSAASVISSSFSDPSFPMGAWWSLI